MRHHQAAGHLLMHDMQCKAACLPQLKVPRLKIRQCYTLASVKQSLLCPILTSSLALSFHSSTSARWGLTIEKTALHTFSFSLYKTEMACILMRRYGRRLSPACCWGLTLRTLASTARVFFLCTHSRLCRPSSSEAVSLASMLLYITRNFWWEGCASTPGPGVAAGHSAV